MRLSTQQMFQSNLRGVLDNQAKLNELQKQIASGKRIGTPADDPVASAQSILIKQQLSLSEQFRSNATFAENRLRLEESTLSTMEDVVQHIRQLTVQAGGGTLTTQDRKAISVDIQQSLEQLVGLANTSDPSGEHIFSGFQSGTQPIIPNSGGGYSYQGDEGQLFIKIADHIDVAVSDSGKALFMNIDEPLNFSVSENGANTGTLAVTNQAVTDQQVFDAFHPDGAIITFDTTGPNPVYTVTRTSDSGVISGGSPPAPLTNIPYAPGDIIEFEGVHIELAGVPADGDTVDLASLGPFKLDLFSAVEKLVSGLNAYSDSSADQVKLAELIADGLLSLDSAQDNILQTEAKIGARLNSIEEAVNNHDNMDLIGREMLSKLEDLDWADAVSKLSHQSFILEVTQKTFSQISNLSLFNFIR